MAASSQFYFDLKKCRFASVLWLDNIFPKKIRRSLAKVFDALLILSFVSFIAIVILIAIKVGIISLDELSFVPDKILDFLFLTLFFRLIIFALESFYRSKSSSGLDIKKSQNIVDYLDFEATALLAQTKFRQRFIAGPNILEVFLGTELGKFVFFHLGISREDFRAFLSGYSGLGLAKEDSFQLLKKIFDEASAKNELEIGVSDIILAILDYEPKIFQFFFEAQIKREDIAGVLEWAITFLGKKEKASRWWLEENLSRIQGIAKDWAYGATYFLDRFSHSFSAGVSSVHKPFHFIGHQKQIEAMEAILSRQAQANVLVVGEPGVGKRTVIAGFNDLITSGRIRPELEYKHLLELDGAALVATAKTKGILEDLIIRLFNDAVHAGNIILIIDDFTEFLNSAAGLGVSLTQILGPYLSSSDLQVIAVTGSSGFKRFLEPDSSLMQYFELVRIEEPARNELLQILEDIALETKEREGMVILYQALKEVINTSITYLTEGSLPERAIDILETVSSRVAGQGRNVVFPRDVFDFVSEKTKMPLGELKPIEKEKLLRLEEIFHQRVVDQEEAISAISVTVRRVRAGIQETKKPLGSFLFLGPTGVGKTETAKALAEIYFGSEDVMSRFDMSEYQNENGLERLIGSFERNEPGLLAAKLREKPYGLLLLDEFEKCHIKVRDLFLQILDEGFFTDAFGKKVFVRNNIIIATSNAASQFDPGDGPKGDLSSCC